MTGEQSDFLAEVVRRRKCVGLCERHWVPGTLGKVNVFCLFFSFERNVIWNVLVLLKGKRKEEERGSNWESRPRYLWEVSWSEEEETSGLRGWGGVVSSHFLSTSREPGEWFGRSSFEFLGRLLTSRLQGPGDTPQESSRSYGQDEENPSVGGVGTQVSRPDRVTFGWPPKLRDSDTCSRKSQSDDTSPVSLSEYNSHLKRMRRKQIHSVIGRSTPTTVVIGSPCRGSRWDDPLLVVVLDDAVTRRSGSGSRWGFGQKQ